MSKEQTSRPVSDRRAALEQTEAGRQIIAEARLDIASAVEAHGLTILDAPAHYSAEQATDPSKGCDQCNAEKVALHEAI